jgi:hypothetical protein
MAYSFEFDPVNAILQTRFSGQVTDELLRSYYFAAGKLAARMHPRAAILDLTDAASFEVSPQTLRDLAREAPALPDVTAPRFVIAPTDYLYGMARMFQLLGEETRPLLHVVRSRNEVFAALGVPEPKFEPVEPIVPD